MWLMGKLEPVNLLSQWITKDKWRSQSVPARWTLHADRAKSSAYRIGKTTGMTWVFYLVKAVLTVFTELLVDWNGYTTSLANCRIDKSAQDMTDINVFASS